MRFHDFFAGLGGSSTGLTAAGMEGVIAFVASLTGVYLLAVLILWRGW